MDIRDLKEVHDANIGIMDAVETDVADWLMKVGQDDWESFHMVLDEMDESERPEDEAIAALATIGLQRIAGLCLERDANKGGK
jgi:hypothetical protein